MIVYAALVGITFNKNHFKSITGADKLNSNESGPFIICLSR